MAAQWLDPDEFEIVRPEGEEPPPRGAPLPTRPRISATPYVWRDPSTIPRRAFVLGTHYARGFLSTTIAAGAIGKTSLAIVEALAMVTGRPLLGVTPQERVRVWLWNGEDPKEEIERRIAAAMIHYGIDRTEVEGWLFFDSGRTMEIAIAKQARNGAVELDQKTIDEITATIRARKIDVATIDPFIASHRVNENDNTAVDVVAKAWGRIAETTNSAIEIVHHSRKTGGAEITVDDGRGASALLWAARSGRTVNTMNKVEASSVGIDKPRGYFRVDNGKANLAPPPEKADWYRLVSVPLGNGDPSNPAAEGDKVAVVTAYEFPDALATVTVENLREAQREVANGGPWRKDSQCADWVGVPIAKGMRLDLANPVDKAKVKRALKVWLQNGMFVEVKGEDAHRRTKTFVEVGEWAND